MSLGVALAGGGLKGVAHIGALRALEELGVKIDYLSGTSSGSIMAAFYAMGFSTEQIKENTKDYYREIVNINKKPLLAAAGSYLIKHKVNLAGIIPGERIEDIVNRLAIKKEITNINQVPMSLAIPTVDAITTKECIFLSKKINSDNSNIEYITDISIGKAVRSSMAFPGIFTPCNYKEYSFMDGGTKDNLPVQVLKDMGASKTLALSFKLDEYEPNGDVFATILRACDIFSLKDVKNAQKISDLSIEIDVGQAKLLEIQDMDNCIKIGYDTIMKNKEKILGLVN